MDDFLPAGYLTLRQAVKCVAKARFGDKWAATKVGRIEESLVLPVHENAKRVVKAERAAVGVYRRGSRPTAEELAVLEQRAEETPEIRAAKDRIAQRHKLLKKAERHLQQLLFAGDLLAEVLTQNGSLVPVLKNIWGGTNATRIFILGYIQLTDGPGCVPGQVLFSERKLETWLTQGSGVSKQPESSSGTVTKSDHDRAPDEPETAPVTPAQSPPAVDDQSLPVDDPLTSPAARRKFETQKRNDRWWSRAKELMDQKPGRTVKQVSNRIAMDDLKVHRVTPESERLASTVRRVLTEMQHTQGALKSKKI